MSQRILTLLLLTMVGAGQMWAGAESNPRVKFIYASEHGTAFASEANGNGVVTITITPDGDWRCIDGDVTAKVTANTNMAQAPRRTQAEVQIGDAIGVTCTATNVFTLTLPEDNNLHVTVTVSFSEKETYIPVFNIENWEYCGSESGANSPSIIELQPADVTVKYKYGTSWNNVNSALVDEKDFESNPPVAVGQYVMVAYVEGNADYNASHSDPVDFKIEPKTLTFGSSDVTGIEKEYDGTTAVANLDEIDIRPQGIVNNQDVKVVVVSGSYASKNVGNNIEVTIDEVNLTGTDKDNYRIDQNTSVKTTGIINQRHVKITGISVTPKVYDGETWADVDCNSAVFDKLVAGDDIRPDYLSASYDNANVGTNKRVSLDYEEYCTGLAGNDKDNYFLDRDGCVGETVGDIQKAPLTVKADDVRIKFGEDAPAFSVHYGDNEGNNLVNNENENVLGGTLAFECDYTTGNAIGDYAITPYGLTSDNYDITFVPGTLTVVPADLQIFAANSTNLWTTYCDSYERTVPNGCSAWAVTGISNNAVTVSEITGTTMPADTPLLISRNEAGADAVSAEYPVLAGSSTAPATNLLQIASSTNQPKAFQDYVLYQDAFYLVSGGTLADGKVFLPTGGSTTAPRLNITMEGEVTSLTPAPSPTGEGSGYWYTLDGRKVNGQPLKKGLYIKNGKKEVVR